MKKKKFKKLKKKLFDISYQIAKLSNHVDEINLLTQKNSELFEWLCKNITFETEEQEITE